MARRSSLGNTNASSLLRQAQSAYERTQAYNDSIAAYEYDLSAKTEADYKKYNDYLTSRIGKTTDPSKQLELTKKQTSAYRSFNSEEIQRASLAVNYGEMSKTQKYNKIFGLLQRAIANGDSNLAQNLETQLSSLDIQIQNDAQAAAARAAAGSKAAAASLKKQLNEFENKIDRAYQTGQPIVENGQVKYLNAADYALNIAKITATKWQMAQQQGEDTSSIEKSPDFRNLIDSGLVQFDNQGNPIATEGLKNLAIKFERDSKTGVVSRSYTAPELSADGKPQYGLVAQPDGSSKNQFVADRTLLAQAGAPKARVAYDVNGLKINGKDQQGVGVYSDLISGNQVQVQTQGDNKGLRSVQYYDKTLGRKLTPEEAQANLDSLVNPDKAKNSMSSQPADFINPFKNVPPPNTATMTANRVLRTGAALATPITGAFGALGSLMNRAELERYRQEAEAKAKAAEAARTQQLLAAYNKQQADLAALRANSQPRPTIVPTAPSNRAFLPTPAAMPSQVFTAALGAATKSASNVAKALGKAVGYNF